MAYLYLIFITTLIISTIQGAPERKISIPLHKNPRYVSNARNEMLNVPKKYTKRGTQTVGQVPVTGLLNAAIYVGTIYVGTPPKPFNIDFDTGSSDFWLSSSNCSVCKSSVLYNASDSSTFSPIGIPWEGSYVDGNTVSGELNYDTVNIGGITIKKLPFYSATELTGTLNNPVINGLMGLGFTSASTIGVSNPFQQMFDRNLISSPIFSVYFGNPTGKDDEGEFIFGGYNSAHIGGKLTTIPVNNSLGEWGIEVNHISVNGKSFLNKPSYAIVDTGTTTIDFPKDIALEIAKYYNATDVGGHFKISCNVDEIPPLEINIGGTTLTIPSESVIYVQVNDNCFSGFSYSGGDHITLGDAFIQNHYVIFNVEVPQIQIAPSK